MGENGEVVTRAKIYCPEACVLLGGEGYLDAAVEGALVQEASGFPDKLPDNYRVSSPQETLSLPAARSMLWGQGLLGLQDPAGRIP